MKTLKIKRPHENFNKHCTYELFVGKNKIANLKNGEEKSIEIPTELENEQLYAKTHWCGSTKINISNIEPNSTISIIGSEFLNRRMPFIIGLFPVVGIIIFTGNSPLTKNIGIAVLVLLLVFLVGTLTIGRNKWLRVEARNS
ncbi:MAG TPA: hypothetical protein PLH91_00280 [Tenuifilaceae bacterium]|nr:hypothetical protein [Tenuifilaceae bacterium]HPI43641.1 hypothetical protein [Tenuifilaceae bacterium]HPN23119.1 hypothetical protein [Tenuifilaceae bacterium]